MQGHRTLADISGARSLLRLADTEVDPRDIVEEGRSVKMRDRASATLLIFALKKYKVSSMK